LELRTSFWRSPIMSIPRWTGGRGAKAPPALPKAAATSATHECKHHVGGPSAILLQGWLAQCYSCLTVGHVVNTYGEIDRKRRCYRCGVSSYRMRQCRAVTPKCPLCVDLERPATHILEAENFFCLSPPPGKKSEKKRGRLNPPPQ